MLAERRRRDGGRDDRGRRCADLAQQRRAAGARTCGGIFVPEREVERDLASLAGLPTSTSPPGLSPTPGCSRRRPSPPTPRPRPRWRSTSCYEIVRVPLADGGPDLARAASFPAERFPGLSTAALADGCTSCCRSEYGLERGRRRRTDRGGHRRRRRGARCSKWSRGRTAAHGRAHDLGHRRTAPRALTTSSEAIVRGSCLRARSVGRRPCRSCDASTAPPQVR